MDPTIITPVYLPNFLTPQDADTLLSELLALDWEQRIDARRELFQAPWPLQYTYGTGPGERTYTARPLTPRVQDTLSAINLWLPALVTETKDWSKGLWLPNGGPVSCWVPVNGCFLNRYDRAQHAIGWHADDHPGTDHTRAVVVVSLGAERELWWRLKGERGQTPPERRIKLAHGSCLIMPPGFQQVADHRIPKSDREVGTRVSLTFRAFTEAFVAQWADVVLGKVAEAAEAVEEPDEGGADDPLGVFGATRLDLNARVEVDYAPTVDYVQGEVTPAGRPIVIADLTLPRDHDGNRLALPQTSEQAVLPEGPDDTAWPADGQLMIVSTGNIGEPSMGPGDFAEESFRASMLQRAVDSLRLPTGFRSDHDDPQDTGDVDGLLHLKQIAPLLPQERQYLARSFQLARDRLTQLETAVCALEQPKDKIVDLMASRIPPDKRFVMLNVPKDTD